MAKQRDDRSRPDPKDPKFGKGNKPPQDEPSPEDLEDIFAAEEVEPVEEVEELADIFADEPPAAEPPPPPEKKAIPTQLARKSPMPTMLAPKEGEESAVEIPLAVPVQPSKGGANMSEEEIFEAIEAAEEPEAVAEVVEPNLSLDRTELADLGAEHAEEAVDLTEEHPVPHAPRKKATPPEEEDIFTAEEVVEEAEPVEAVEEDIFAAEEQPESADLFFGEEMDMGTAKGVGGLEGTVAFTPPEAQDSSEEELVGAEELAEEGSSAVDLGAMPKGERPSGVDRIAEAVESGVDLSGEGALISPPPRKRVPEEPEGEIAEFAQETSAVDLGHLPTGAKKGTRSTSLDDIAVDVFNEETAPAAAEEAPGEDFFAEEEPVRRRDMQAKLPVEEEIEEPLGEAEEAFEVEEPTPPVKGRKRKAVEEEEEELAVAATATGGKKAKSAKPKYARRWLGGTFVGIILSVGASAGLWYAKPDTLDMMIQNLPDSPNGKLEKSRYKPPTPLQLAHAQMDKGDYAKALTLLEGAEGSPETLVARAEARWLKYLQEQNDKKGPLNKDDEAVKKALEELQQANNTLLPDQILKTIENKPLRDNVAVLQVDQKNALAVRDVLVKAAMVKPNADLKDIPPTVDKILADKKQAENLVDGIGDALVTTKNLDDKAKLDVPAFQKIAKALTDAKQVLDGVNKKLEDAKVEDLGEKGVAKVLTDLKDVGDKLGGVNKVLTDAKVKDKDAKGVAELVANLTKLATEKKDLDEAVAAAFKELVGGQFLPAGADARKELAAGTKVARQKAESPLAIPLSHFASAMSEVGWGIGKLVQRGLHLTALATEVTYFRLREPLIQQPENKLDTYLAMFQNRQLKETPAYVQAAKEVEWLRSPEARGNPETKAKALYVLGLSLRNQEKFADARKVLAAAVKEGATLPKQAEVWVKQAADVLGELTDPNIYYLPRLQALRATGNLQEALKEANLALQAIPDDGRLLNQRSLIKLALAGDKVSAELRQQIQADAGAAKKTAEAEAEACFILGLLEETTGQVSKAGELFREAIKIHKGPADGASRYRIALARLLLRESAAAEPTELTPEPKTKEDKGTPEPKTKEDKKAPEPKTKEDKGTPAPKTKEDKGTPAPKTKEDKKGPEPKTKDDKEDKTSRLEEVGDPRLALLVLAMVGVQAADDTEDPAETKRLQEIIEQARELIKSADAKIKGQGYMILGQALSKQGRRTEGIKEFARGMQLLFPGTVAQDLSKLVEEHPAFQQPDAQKQANPFAAEQFYGRGLHFYWVQQYPQAEEQFKLAVTYHGQDARYRFFLGLAQYQQKTRLKRDAAFFSFEQGAQLEAQNRPPASEVNLSLERIQGDLRQLVNGFRQKAIVGGN